MTTHQQIIDSAIGPQTAVGARVRRHLAPPLVEDLEQAVASALREAVRAEREASARAAWHAAALWEATRRPGADESVSEVVAAAVRGREV